MCNELIKYIQIDELRYGLNVFIFSSIIYFLNLIIKFISNEDMFVFHNKDKYIRNYLYWTIGAFLTSLILVYLSLVTTSLQSSIFVSIGWIKLYTDLFEKYSNQGPPSEL